MTSSLDTRRQPTDGDGEPSNSAERFELASIPGSLGGPESNHPNETPVLSDAQRQSTSEIEVKSTDKEGENEEWREERKRREEEESEREALRQVMEDLKDKTGFDSYEAYLESYRRDQCMPAAPTKTYLLVVLVNSAYMAMVLILLTYRVWVLPLFKSAYAGKIYRQVGLPGLYVIHLRTLALKLSYGQWILAAEISKNI